MSVIESDFMVEMEGTEVTTTGTDCGLQSKTWVIREKVNEHAYLTTKMDRERGWGPPCATAKFRCYDKSDPARKLAFMRIYRQVPLGGTEWTSLPTRAAQAIPHRSHSELEALKIFKQENCSDVPQLLGYHEGQQPDNALVPGGFTSTVVWETVPGYPLSRELFWGFDRTKRNLIRAEFLSVLRLFPQAVLLTRNLVTIHLRLFVADLIPKDVRLFVRQIASPVGHGMLAGVPSGYPTATSMDLSVVLLTSSL
ncbi:hypothetical protein N7454_004474 [Penicillium verhagenii]|nr:hypothetical protein N7454_004474 [Penicillium verhagenii]